MIKNARKLFKSYLQEKPGSIIIIFALTLTVLMGLAGLAIDYSRKHAARSLLSSALDAAALAAANSTDKSDKGRQAIADAIFEANLRNTMLGRYAPKPRINFRAKDRILDASSSVVLPTSLLSAVGVKELHVGAYAEVTLPPTKKTEISLVLDASFSMINKDNRWNKMRGAILKFLRDVGKSAEDKNDIKFGLVPFSGAVLVTLPGHAVVGGIPGTLWTGCVQDRQHPYNINGLPVNSSHASKWGHPLIGEQGYPTPPDCDHYKKGKLELILLTSDNELIFRRIWQMVPVDSTHIAAGMSFGYDLLNPHSIFGTAAPFNDETRKFLILITDGKQTTLAYGPGSRRTAADGERNLSSLCQLARSKGIKIATVSLMLSDQATVHRLKHCASEPKLSFDVSDADQLAIVFETIAHYVREQPYLSK